MSELINPVRRALLERRLSLGSWIQIGHPGVAEVLARAGFDWLCVDMEHGAIGFEEMANCFRAIEAGGSVPAVRIPKNDPVWIHRSLDAGARMLIVPMIANAAEAEAAVAEAKYPPRGRRGFGYARANGHGMDFDAYRNSANEEIAVVLQIEHIDAIRELDAILDVPGVDALFIGPLDLTGSMGLTGEMEHPDVVEALRIYRNACQRRGVAAGMHIVRPSQESIRKGIGEGYTLIALGLDNVLLGEAARASIEEARKAGQPESQL